MLTIRIEGVEKVVSDMEKIFAKSPEMAQLMLDRLATETAGTMRSNAPNRTGVLRESVNVSIPSTFVRVIEPLARYAAAVETGTHNYATLPNLTNIAEYFGTGDPMSRLTIAIALSIKEKGTPQRSYVMNTYEWLIGQIDREAFSFLNQVVQ